jgi:pyruvate kinase
VTGAACKPCHRALRPADSGIPSAKDLPLSVPEKFQANGVVSDAAELADLARELAALRAELAAAAASSPLPLEQVHPDNRASAINLLHYLALRRQDIRALQDRLSARGLSSLGRAESHVLDAVDSVLGVVCRLAGCEQPPAGEAASIGHAAGRQLLQAHAAALLGPARAGRDVRILVTMPTEAASDPALVRELLLAGMDGMRINCAHDDADAWAAMIGHLRQAQEETGLGCRVVMDLGGPKLRTGPVQPGPAVLRVRPRRDALGRVTAPARVWLAAAESPQSPPSAADAVLALPQAWIAGLREGDPVGFVDARDARRLLRVSGVQAGGAWAEIAQTCYLVPGTHLQHLAGTSPTAVREAVVGALPAKEGRLLLRPGDLLLLVGNDAPGCAARLDADGTLLARARIGCTIPAVLAQVRAGEPIYFDDGRIGGVIEQVEAGAVRVRITEARREGSWLRGNKGINLPASRLQLAALTEQDLRDLDFVARHADIVELSFASRAADVEQLQQELAQRGQQPAIVLKIETEQGFRNLPEMLLAALRAPRCGVMIARGDLAVECGFERLAEVQEEILWICEAAHVPAIWATQVLETLAHDGLATRAEITDAAMGSRAECVMLNKGPFVQDAVQALDDILRRMQAHQLKKQSMLRELHLAHALDATSPVAAGSGG